MNESGARQVRATGVGAATHIGPYRILEELGAGAMGTVYLAEDADEGDQVALKVLHPHLLARKGFFLRFQREALAGQRVRHANVVRTLDCSFHVVDAQPLCVLVMEYVRGRTLRALLHDLTTVPETLVREIGRQAAEALAAIHGAGIVHRDLKPENILITEDHRVRIMDLGVARHMDLSTAITSEGQFAGSLLYAAPEQLQGSGGARPAADLYALGVVLYELVSGVNPFRRDDPGAVIHAQIDLVPERLDRRTEQTSPFLSEVVATLLAKDPEARFENASVLAEVLADAEGAAWWRARERHLLAERVRRVRVPVRRETRIYGRAEDLALCMEAWRQAREGQGNTLLLEGEAGIGKSRLVDALLAQIDGEEAHVLYGSYPPSAGRGAIPDALVEHFGRAELEDALRPYLSVTPSLVPALAALLKRDVLPAGVARLQGDALHTACVHLMRAMAEERPLVWVIEDLHFADADSRRLVLSLARAVEGHPILLCLTTRPGLSEQDLANFSRLETLRRAGLGRLGARDVVLLLEDAFRSVALAEKLGIRIAKKSDGVPFFVFEMIRGLREGQFITQLPDGSWVESKVIDDIEVPSAVRDLIGIRLRDLTKKDRAILDVGAVQGFEFDPDLVARVLERPRLSVFQDVADIERRSGVLRSEGRNLRFDHHQIQEVVYEGLLPVLREEYHTLLARALAQREGASEASGAELPGETAAFLAAHGLRGSEPREGLPNLEPALDHLRQVCAHERALDLCDTALDVPDLLTDRERLRVLGWREHRLKVLGRPVEREAALDEARALAERLGDEEWSARVDTWIAAMCLTTGRAERAQACIERALPVVRKLGYTADEAGLTINLGLCHNRFGRLDEAQACYERGLERARACGNPEWEANAESNLGSLANSRGRLEEARGRWEHAQTIFRDHGLHEGEARTWLSLGKTSLARAQFERAREELERALTLYEQYGLRANKADVLGALGRLASARGEYEEAEAHLQRALGLCDETGELSFAASFRSSLAWLCDQRGDAAQALAQRETAIALCRRGGDPYGEATILAGLGNLYTSLGRPAEGRQRSLASLEMLAAMPGRGGAGRVRGHLGHAAVELGDVEEAERLYRQGLALCRTTDELPHKAWILQSLGDLLRRSHRSDEASTVLEEALAASRVARRPDLEVLVLCEQALLPEGDVGEAIAGYGDQREQMSMGLQMQACYLLWHATNDGPYLAEAKRLLDHLVEHAPEAYRASMVEGVRLHREVLEAWKSSDPERAE